MTKVDFEPRASFHQDTQHVRRSTFVKRSKLGPANYLRAALAYMLISMPQGTSTIFGDFQAIWLSLQAGTFSALVLLNYRARKSSLVKSC